MVKAALQQARAASSGGLTFQYTLDTSSAHLSSGELPLIRKPFNAETLLQHLQDSLP